MLSGTTLQRNTQSNGNLPFGAIIFIIYFIMFFAFFIFATLNVETRVLFTIPQFIYPPMD